MPINNPGRAGGCRTLNVLDAPWTTYGSVLCAAGVCTVRRDPNRHGEVTSDTVARGVQDLTLW